MPVKWLKEEKVEATTPLLYKQVWLINCIINCYGTYEVQLISRAVYRVKTSDCLSRLLPSGSMI